MTPLGMRFLRYGLGVALGLCLMSIGFQGVAQAEIIPLQEIVPGMTGFGLTVFAGDEVDTFGVKVIGIQERSRIAGSLILIEVSGYDLATSGIAQGMSGSPIFLDGRLAGALAFGWGGALKPIAGVTPAGEMLTLPTEPGPAMSSRGKSAAYDPRLLMVPHQGRAVAFALAWPWRGGAGQGAVGKLSPWPDPGELLQALIPELISGTDGAALPVGWFQVLPGDSAHSSHSAAGVVSSLVPGAACAIPLVMGDALLGVIGTTTWVQGDDVFMMGHPFLQRGPVRWPLATAQVLTVLPSRQMSFKMAGIGELVGTVYHDQRPGMTGRLGAAPHMIPVTTKVVTDTEQHSYSFKIVDDFALSPPLAFWCLYNSLLVRGDDASQQSVHYRVVTHWQGNLELAAEPLELRGVVAGPGGVQGLAAAWMAPLTMLLNNSETPLTLTGLEAEFTVDRPAAVATISSLDAPGKGVAGQGPLLCTVRLQPQRGTAQTISVALDLPAYLAPGPYKLVAASEADLFGLEVQRLGMGPRLDTLHDLIGLLRKPRAADKLVVALVAPGGGVVLAGHEMPDLPGSKNRLLTAVDPTVGRLVAQLPLRTTVPVAWSLSGAEVRNLILTPGNKGFDIRTRP